MFDSIRAKLGAIFLSFALLVAGSVGATFVLSGTQAADACVINLAGRQRMLSQKMSQSVLGLAGGAAPGYRAELAGAADLFDRTLSTFLEGGPISCAGARFTLAPAASTAIRGQLERIDELWDQFGQELAVVQAAAPGSIPFTRAVSEVERLSPIMLQEVDDAVRLYEEAAGSKIARMRSLQVAFFAAAVGLLISGHLLTRRAIVKPLSALEAATQRIACGDLSHPATLGPSTSAELRVLADSFGQMCRQLAASQDKLERWAVELETRVAQRTRQLAALFQISAEISSKLEIQQVLESIVEKTCHLAGGEVAALCLLNPSGESLTVAAISGPDQACTVNSQARLGDLAVQESCAVDLSTLHEGNRCRLLRPSYQESHLVVPMRLQGWAIGMLCVGHRQAGRFGEEEARLLGLLANTGAVALENARLYERVEHEAALEERERIVARIHDGLAQTLAFLGLRLGTVKEAIEKRDLADVPANLALMQHTVEQAGQEIRRLMAGLQRRGQDGHALEGLLRTAVAHLEEQGLAVELRLDPGAPLSGSEETFGQVVRVVQEALVNAYKHAPGCRAVVSLERQEGQAVVRIEDDGPGFELDSLPGGSPHFGLKVMRARAEWLGGKLQIESDPGQGTRVILSWPVGK